jgi:hypothetical protein
LRVFRGFSIVSKGLLFTGFIKRRKILRRALRGRRKLRSLRKDALRFKKRMN